MAGSSLAGKSAIVTGASRGIGRSIAEALAEAGAKVLLTATNTQLLGEACREMESMGRMAVSYPADLRQPQSAGGVVDAAIRAFGCIDILVNNAGATKRGDFLALSDEDWADGYALKFFGAVRLCRAAWPHLTASGGSIVNIAGVGGRTPGKEFTIGGSVNAALLSFTKALSDLGIEDGVQVNTINPGAVDTDRLQKRIRTRAEQLGVSEDEAADVLRREMHITRFGEPQDVASLVRFLVSSEGRWMQGSLIDIDGGQTKTV